MSSRKAGRPRRARAALLAALCLLLTAAGIALGVWQLQRRVWKHALIAAIESRANASPQTAPGPSAWGGITAQADAYRRVRATGRFRHDREILVQAVTERGSGYWVLTPLEMQEFTVLVNRGFAPPIGEIQPTAPPAAQAVWSM